MGLKLFGKGSIVSAIGGGLKDAANTGIDAVKDVGDVADIGFNTITGNQGGVNNAEQAIQNNNPVDQNLATNLGGLSRDVGLTTAVQQAVNTGEDVSNTIGNAEVGIGKDLGIHAKTGAETNQQQFGQLNNDVGLQTESDTPRNFAGSAIATGVNALTLGKGKAIEELGEQTIGKAVGDGVLGRAIANFGGRAGVGAFYGGGQGASNAAQNAQTWQQAAGDIIKPAVENAALAGATAIPKVIGAAAETATPLDEVGGINNRPVPAPNTDVPVPDMSEADVDKVHESNPFAVQSDEVASEDTMPEPSQQDLATSSLAAEHLDQTLKDPDIDWDKVQGANDELNSTIKQVASHIKQEDLMSRAQPTDLYKRIKAAGGISTSDYEDLPTHLKNGKGASMDRVAQELGYADDNELHDAIQKEQDIRAGGKPQPKTAAEYQQMAKDYIAKHAADPQDENDAGFRDLLKRAQAEKDVQDYAAADKKSGYSKAKYQVPKGAPAKQFRQDLYEKTHSPEFQKRNDTGAQLQDTRNTMQGVKKLRDRAQKEYDQLTGKKSNASADDIRAKAAELRSQNTRYNALQSAERDLAARYRMHATDLDAKYPDTDLVVPKKGVRLTSNTQRFETARPVASEVEPSAKGVKVTTDTGDSRLSQYEQMKAEDQGLTADEYIKQRDVETAKTEAQREAQMTAEAKQQGISLEQYKANRAEEIEKEWSPEALDQLSKAQEPAEPERSVEGDRAILEGIKNGDSDASIVQAYQDATGESLDQAKAAYGLMEDDPNVDKTGDVANNPHFGKHADYDIEDEAPSRGVRVRTVTARANYLINKALLRATAPGDHMVYKMTDASHLWDQLNDHDQELADQLRNHSISELADKADDRHAFQAYAMRAKDIEDYIHATRGIADPGDLTPYRQNYGAGFNLATPEGTTVSEMEALGQDPHALARHYSTYEELKDATGFDRATSNFHEDLANDVGRAQNSIANHSLVNGLNQAFGDGSASYGEKTRTATTQLNDFPNVFADKKVADRINARAAYEYNTDKIGSVLKYADKTNSAMKNIKLSVGGFHNINEMLNQLALNPSGAGAASRALIDSDYFRQRMNEWDNNGTMEKALHSGLTLGPGDEIKQGFSSNFNKLPVIKQFHEALFGRQIPMSKMQVFERYTKQLNLNDPTDYARMRGVARGVNNTFGGINRLVDGLSPTRMKQLSRFVLAEDYNEGQIRTLLTALDPTRIGTTEGRMAMQVVAGRAAMLSLPGVIQGVITGQIGNNPKDIAKFVGNQLVNPTVQTGFKTAGGNPKQINLIAGIVNKTYRSVAPAFNSNNPDKTSGLVNEASGNLSPLASLTNEEATNKDFYGNPMHGHGMTPAQDFGQAFNAAAPIPFSPGSRALEGTRFGKGSFVKTLAGGQSAISPTEAAIDTSGIGRVAANPNAPAMQIMNNRELVRQGLSSDDQGVLDQIHPSWNPNLSKQQQAAIYNSPDYEINKWSSMDNPQVLAALKKQNDFATAHGEPGDPLFKLSPKDQATVIRYEQLKSSDPGSDANDTAAVIYSQNKDLINGYENGVQSYEAAMTKLYNQSGGLKGSNEPQITPGGVPYPSISTSTQNLVNQYYGMTDAKARATFLTENPEVEQAFNAMSNYENAKRASLGEPLLKDYPTASKQLESFMDQYTAASKTDRTGLRTANPTLYNQMSDYMGQVDQYNLARTLGQSKYQGTQPTQENLKEEYDLGQYDINPDIGSNGVTTYSLNPQAAYQTKQTSENGPNSEVQKLINDMERKDAMSSVKYAGKKAYIRKQYGSKKIYLARPKGVEAKRPVPKGVTVKRTPITT